jgi:ABC-2 type transport system permease protein
MGAQEQSHVIVTLVKREFKRYFASTVYLSNTIMGPILAVAMAVSLFFIDLENAVVMLPVEIDVIGILPLAVGTIFCIMNTTSTSVSMEGKEWWLIKSLPLTSKQILDAKLLMNIILFAPFYVVAVVISIIALRPSGLEIIWMVISPAVLILFSCVWGLFINLKVPVFNWENETSVVKQSVSALVGGICGSLVGVVMMFGLVLAPVSLGWIMKVVYMVVLLVITAILYDLNNKVKLENLT